MKKLLNISIRIILICCIINHFYIYFSYFQYSLEEKYIYIPIIIYIILFGIIWINSNKFKGKWQLKYHPKNEISKIFWTKIIREYTNDKYELITNNPETKYEDGTIGHVLIFET